MGEADGGLAEREQVGIDLAAIERLGIGRGAASALAKLVPEGEPFAKVLVVEAELALCIIERLAALSEPDFERGLFAAAILDARVAIALCRLGDLDREIADLLPCHLPVRRLQAEALDDVLVVDQRGGVEAETDPIDLAVDLAAIDRGLVEIR